MPLPTTRFGRFLVWRSIYLQRQYDWYARSWRWIKDENGKSQRSYRKWEQISGPQLRTGLKTGKTTVAGIIAMQDPFTPMGILTLAQHRKPPYVTSIFPPYLASKAKGHHWHSWHVGYQRRRVLIRQKRPRDQRNTAFNRQVTGCNWYYFRNQFFPDTDVLGRRPNFTDVANGGESGLPGWPDPLGYQ